MHSFAIGQRYFSEPELPELGLGSVVEVGSFHVEIDFAGSGETRRYASDTGVLRRISVSRGESVETTDGRSFRVHEIVVKELLYEYSGDGAYAREDELAWVESFGSASRSPPCWKMPGQARSSLSGIEAACDEK